MSDVQGLAFGRPGRAELFRDFNLRLERGESLAIIGPSGCGKSSLLLLLARLLLPTSGRILIDGEEGARPRPRTGLVLQDHGLLPWATAEANVGLGHAIRRFYGPDDRHAPRDEVLSRTEARRRADFWLGRLGLAGVSRAYPGQLSRGQGQRGALARTMVLDPDLLLLDEAFSALDAPTALDLRRLILDLAAERGLTMALVTHDVEEAALMGRSILSLSLGVNFTRPLVSHPFAGDLAARRNPAFHTCCARLRLGLESGRQE